MTKSVLSVQAAAILKTFDEETIETLVGCSSYEQFYDMLRTYLSDECPCRFCNIDREKNEVLYEENGWVAWEVSARYTTRKSTLQHQIVFFPAEHVRRMDELSTDQRLGYFTVIEWIHKKFKCPGGGIITRFGDMRYNVGTVMHLHSTMMIPNRKGRVIVPLQKSQRMHRNHTKRMYDFLERYVLETT